MRRIFISGALCLGLIVSHAQAQNCAEDKVRKCISIAEPMLKDPQLIFPDNTKDIESVCRAWSSFVDCIRRYIDKCFSKLRKEQFNSAVEPPIESVHQMCSVSAYQAEYLQYAGCIKSTVVEPEHCGAHYATLVDEVSQEKVRKANLCCAYQNLRSCVIAKTRSRCDSNQPDGVAATFSRQVLDKAFRFLQDQCLGHVRDASECAAIMSSPIGINRLGEGRSVSADQPNRTGSRRTSLPPSADSYRNNRLQAATATSGGQSHDVARPPSKFATSPRADLDSPAPPSSSKLNSGEDEADAQSGRRAEPARHPGPAASATQRSLSYGRGITWSAPTAPVTATPEIPAWATDTWLTHSQDLTTEEIYPAAGSFGGNNIDEPNQQGLSRNNAQASIHPMALLYLLIILSCALVL